MTSYTDKGPKPEVGNYSGYDHVVMWVGNAKQAATYYIARLGFESVAYRGLENGHRETVSHVVRKNKITLVLQSALNPGNREMGEHLVQHGDGVRDIAFSVDDAAGIYHRAVSRGAKSVRAPWQEQDEHGHVVMATVQTYGDTHHTFVQRSAYKGIFLPGFLPLNGAQDPLVRLLPDTKVDFIDHIVGNQPDNEMVPICEWYQNCLGWHRFWSVDDKQMSTEFSALRSIGIPPPPPPPPPGWFHDFPLSLTHFPLLLFSSSPLLLFSSPPPLLLPLPVLSGH